MILTVGGSPRGRAMVAAHSGALAGEHAAWQAFCAATGAVHVSDLAEFTDTLELFSAGRRSRGGGVATVHDSGAERALVADLAHELGVPFADLAADTLAAIGGMLDDGSGADQPAGRLGHRRRHPQPVRRLPARDGCDDPGVACHRARRRPGHRVRRRHRLRRRGDSTSRSSTDAPLAVLASVPSAIDAPTAQRLRDNGIPVLEGFRSGLAALGHLARWPLPVDRPDEPDDAVERRIPTGAVGVRTAGRLRDAGRAVADRRFDRRGAGGGRSSSAIRSR